MVVRARPDDDDRGRDRGRNGGSTRGKWHYEPEKAEKIQERASRTGGRFDSIFKAGVDTWRPKAGGNNIRFLPGTWGLGVPYAFPIWVHRNVGPDDSTYLCLDRMLGKFCPVCEAAAEAKRAKDDEEAKALRAVEQRAAWILDRDGEKTQPLMFAMSWTMDRDILTLTKDKKQGQLWIDNPTEGYDVTLNRSGTGLNTRYFGYAIDRDSSPIAPKDRDIDKVIDYINDNPIPECLNYYDADYLEKVLSGTSGPREDKEEKVAAPRGRERERDDKDKDEDRPARSRRDDPDPEREDQDRDERQARKRDEPEERTPRRGRDEPEEREERVPRRGRDEPEERPGRRAARDEAKDEEDEDRGGRGRREPDDAPSSRARAGNGRRKDDDEDEPPFEPDRPRRERADEDGESRPRRASRDEPEPRGRPASDEDEDRRPRRR